MLTISRLASWVRNLSRKRRAKTVLPDWRDVGDRQGLRDARLPEGGPRILLATNVGSFLPGTLVESLLGAALGLRGAECHVLLCDSVLPACLACEHRFFGAAEPLARHGPQRSLCAGCFDSAAACFGGLPIGIHRFSELVADPERAEAHELARTIRFESIATFRHESIAVGEHAMAGALRFFARGDLEGEACAEEICRRYLEAALLTVFAVRRLLDTGFDAVVCHHGIYVPQGLVGEVARSRGVRVVNWNTAYRKHCFIFSHDDTYHHTLMDEPASAWEDMPWTERHERQIVDYLRSRWDGRHDWITFQKEPQLEIAAIERETGLDFGRPTIGLLTNVVWDAQLHYPANAFASMLDWLFGTIEYFRKRPDLQLAIRVHPAEIRGSVPSRQLVADEVTRVIGDLPKNVVLIPPDSRVSTYAVAEQCDAVIIYGTKMGVELSSLGIPVIVAGEAWIRGKGITHDARTGEEYYRILDRLPFHRRMDEATVTRARRYAYHFFFRRMIPLRTMAERRGWPPFVLGVSDLTELAPGADRGLDVICDGILHGTPFVYPAERLDP